MEKLTNENNWFFNISGERITKENLRTPLFLTEYMEYIQYMLKEGKYENSKGFNEFYICQFEIDPNSKIFGLQSTPDEDEIELLEEYLSRIRQLKFNSHEKWGKSYTKQEIIKILCKEKIWYITEADFMQKFYKLYNYDGYITEEYAGYTTPFENLCILNKDKVLTIEVEEPQLQEHTKIELAKEIAQIDLDDNGVKRRSSGKPHWTHTQSVADIVEAYGGSEAQIIAAHFHDTIEDGSYPIDSIEEKFGLEVLNLILELTNDDEEIKRRRKYNNKFYNNEESFIKAKEGYMNGHLLDISDETLLIKLADILSNLSDRPTDSQRDRMVRNVNFLRNNRSIIGKNKELLNAITGFIRMKGWELNKGE